MYSALINIGKALYKNLTFLKFYLTLTSTGVAGKGKGERKGGWRNIARSAPGGAGLELGTYRVLG